MLNHARRHALVVPFVASFCLFWVSDTWAQSADDLPPAEEPWLGEPDDRYAIYNDAVMACYEGSMTACDEISLDERILIELLVGPIRELLRRPG